MAIIEAGGRTAAYLISEANGMYRSRDEVTVDATAAALPAGQVLGGPVAGEYVAYNAGGADGSEDVAGILWEAIPEGVTAKRTINNADCEVALAELTFTGTEATVVAGLNALGIKVR